ncbi:MAG: hypothetical protein DHS80DRAFT_31104 [Piptocephalis tieghemiana]|nr:MAG: hypothetical protein DHS80DRAFT_31104 [Piptocephalis tieghemiana]
MSAVFLLTLLALFSSCFATLTLTDSNNTVLAKVATQSFFQLGRPPSQHSGILVPLPLARQDNKCALGPLPPLANLTSSPHHLSHTSETIFLADWRQASDCGLDTLAQLAQLALQARSALVTHSYPPPLALIILLGRQYSGVPGNPLREPYLAHSAWVPDQPPTGMDVQIVATSDATTLINTLTSQGFPLRPPTGPFTPRPPLQANLDSEEGPWNATFLSPAFLATQWIIFSLNAILCLWALYQMATALRHKTFSLDLRNAIYLTGLLATLLLTSFLPLPMVTYSRSTMESLHAFVTNVAFLLLLLLWSRFLRRILPQTEHRQVQILRGLVALGALTSVWHLAICLIQANVFPINGRLDEFRDVSNILLPVTQILIAAQFLISSLHTRRRLRNLQLPTSMDRAMSRVALLAWTFFIATLFFSIVTSQSIRMYLGRPATLALYWVMTMLLNTAQNVILLCVSGVRMSAGNSPPPSPHVGNKGLARSFTGNSFDSDKTLQSSWASGEQRLGGEDPKDRKFKLPFAWTPHKMPSSSVVTARLAQLKEKAFSKLPIRSTPSAPPVPPSQLEGPAVQLRRPTVILAKIDEEDGEGGCGRDPKARNMDFTVPWSLAVAENSKGGAMRKESCYNIDDDGDGDEGIVAGPEGQVPMGVILTRRPSSWGSLGNQAFRADHQWEESDDDEDGTMDHGHAEEDGKRGEEEEEEEEDWYEIYSGRTSRVIPRKDSDTNVSEGQDIRWSEISTVKISHLEGPNAHEERVVSASGHEPWAEGSGAGAGAGAGGWEWGARRRSSAFLRRV